MMSEQIPPSPHLQQLQVIALSKKFDSRMVLNCISFNVQRGSIVGLLGPNGAGKTTAFYMVAGLLKPDSGQILFMGQNITHMACYERARLGIGFLAQEPSIFRDLSVEDNLRATLEFHISSKKIIQERIDEALESLHLVTLRKKHAGVLSGGERRRLEIARTLILEPKFILLDEPFANVDPLTIADVQSMVRILRARGIGILITDHNAREIFQIADFCYLMSGGEMLAQGSPQELVASERVRERYLGHGFKM